MYNLKCDKLFYTKARVKNEGYIGNDIMIDIDLIRSL